METEKNTKGLLLWLPVIVVSLAQVGTSGDNSVLSMSTNEFINKLSATMDQVQLANIVYSLLAGALMVFGGMLGIAKGFKQVFMVGAALCSLGELLAVLSPNMFVLVWAARSLTGFGAALMIPSVLGIIASLYQGKERAIAFGAIGAATGLAAVLMPVGAGIIIDASGYQAAFSTMSVWFALIFIGAWKIIPNIKAADMRVDYLGTVLMALTLFMFIIGTSKISVWGLITPLNAPFTLFGISPALPLIFLSIIFMLLIFSIEKRIEAKHGAALIPQSFIKTRQVRNGLYVTGLIFAVFGAVFFVTLSWIMVVANFGGTATGVVIAFMATPMIGLSLILPKRYAHISPRLIVFVSTGAIVLGTIATLFSLELDGFNMLMYVGLFLMGTGLGGYSSQSAMIVAQALNLRDAAQSGGIQTSTRNIWQAAGVAIIGAVLLFSSTAFFKADIAKSDLGATGKAYVAEKPIFGFMSNAKIKEKIIAAGAPEDKAEMTVNVYKKARVKSARWAYWALVVFVMLHIPGFFGIPTEGWATKEK